MHAQGNGVIPNFIHFCGIDGHIRPTCYHYIKMHRVESMIKKRKARAKMHVLRKDRTYLHDPLTSSALEPLTTRIENVSPKWTRKDEPTFYNANLSPIGSTKSSGLGKSIGPYIIH